LAIFNTLSREQKEAVGLLQVGTFLEYFDLFLFVHMAVILNELFFPQTDPHTAALLTAFAFCSTYVLRPFGALLFGYIGDRIGRKATVIITTTMMSLSCVIMATLPTYAQVGITATWLVTGCRICQGLSSMGEIVGAKVFITETLSGKAQYAMVSFIVLSASMGGMAALAIASLVTHYDFNWRNAFWIGATIALVGSVARTRLRETPEFADYKRRKKIEIEKTIKNPNKRRDSLNALNVSKEQKTPLKTMLAFFFIECSYPLVFFMIFMFFNPLLKKLGLSSPDILFHNLILSCFSVFLNALVIFAVMRFHPFSILNIRATLAIFSFLIIPIVLYAHTSYISITLIQLLLILTQGGCNPGEPIILKKIHVGKRFTFTSFNYALSRAVMHVLASFGLVYLTEWMGHAGLWIIGIPVSVAYFWGIRHFKTLEGLRPDKSSNSDSSVGYGQAARFQ
jgi:MHS family proline/betaine transporter-like MFS transporter